MRPTCISNLKGRSSIPSTVAGSGHAHRSDTVMLVNNIPYDTPVETIREIPALYGKLSSPQQGQPLK